MVPNLEKMFAGIAVFCLMTITVGVCQIKPSEKAVDMIYQDEEENLQVFHQWIRWNNPGSLLMNHLIEQSSIHYDQRDQEIARLTSRDAWMARQATVRKKLNDIVGPFPEKTPINPIITGVVKKKGYRIEKIVYESRPDFFVTGCLFIPDEIKGKAPAVLNLIGHEQESYKAPLDQVVILNLVSKGIIVFTIDPLGQGEHVQYFDPKVNFSSIGYSVVEHCYFGNQCFLSGNSSAKYFIWDGIRAIDYLVSRKEVDVERIGVTGFSVGGEIEKLVRMGYVVAAADVLGVGETANTAARGIADGYSAVLLGKSIVGIQAGDVSRVVRYLTGLNGVDPSQIGAIGIDEMCIPLIHAAAFDSSLNNITLVGSLISYQSIVMNRIYKVGVEENKGGGTHHPYEVNFSWGIAGVLTAYDLPDLLACIAPRKLLLIDSKDHMLQPASDSLMNHELSFPRKAYALKNASANIKILKSKTPIESLVGWGFE